MAMIHAVMTVLCLSGSTFAQVVKSGPCPDVQVQKDLDMAKVCKSSFCISSRCNGWAVKYVAQDLKLEFLYTLIMAMLYALIALCLTGSTLAQVIRSGTCPDVEVAKNFSITKFAGKWYEQARFWTLYENGGVCGLFDYIIDTKNSTPILIHTFTSSITEEEKRYETVVLLPEPEEPARMLRKHPLSPVYNNAVVLGTDYDRWGVVYSCNDVCSMKLEYAWIVTRAQVPDEDALDEAYAVLEKNNIDTSLLMKVEQEECSK